MARRRCQSRAVIDRTFLGGMSLEIPFYGAPRLNSSLGTARLRVTTEGLWLGPRTRTLPRDPEWHKSDIVEAFRTKSLLVLITGPGVGFTTVDDKTHYFWTLRPNQVLATLRAAGYQIGKTRRPRGVIVRDLSL
jgi:hypothetical protein